MQDKAMLSFRNQRALLAWAGILMLSLFLTIPAVAQEGTDEETLTQGAQLYAENCAVCHGPEGKGRVGATLSQDWPSIRPDLRVKEAIENGIPGSVMPAWSQDNGGPLAAEQIDALVAFILSWQSGEPPVILPAPTPVERPLLTPLPDVEGDPNHGAVLFDQNCAVCHGPDGEGRVGATLAKDFPSIRPDLRVKAVIDRGVEGSVMPAWSQENGGPLSETDVNDLVAFILTLGTAENPPSVPGGAEETPATQIDPQVWIFFGILGAILVGAVVVSFLGRRK
jgi:mono/diheme cytochrome c family protein